MNVFNVSQLPGQYTGPFGTGNVTQLLSSCAGSKRLCVNLDIIQPGSQSTKYHAHSAQEEFFFILDGSGLLRTAKGEQLVHRGDFVAKPAGFENPHTFYNNTGIPLKILDISTVEPADMCYYPEEDVYLLRGTDIALSGSNRANGFTSQPE